MMTAHCARHATRCASDCTRTQIYTRCAGSASAGRTQARPCYRQCARHLQRAVPLQLRLAPGAAVTRGGVRTPGVAVSRSQSQPSRSPRAAPWCIAAWILPPATAARCARRCWGRSLHGSMSSQLKFSAPVAGACAAEGGQSSAEGAVTLAGPSVKQMREACRVVCASVLQSRSALTTACLSLREHPRRAPSPRCRSSWWRVTSGKASGERRLNGDRWECVETRASGDVDTSMC